MGKIKLTDQNMTVKIDTNHSVVGIDELIDHLIIPSLLGLGFSERLISQYIKSGVLDGNPQ